MTTRTRWPEPSRITDAETAEYLRTLVRTLGEFDSALFSQDSKVMFNTTRVRPYTEVSSGRTIGVNESVVLADASASSLTLTLPLTVSVVGTFFDIKKIDANAATTVSVEGSGPELPFVLNGVSRPSVTLFCDGTKYWII